MHKTHIFDQNNNAKKIFLPTYLPYFFRIVTGNKQLIFLGLKNICEDIVSLRKYGIVSYSVKVLIPRDILSQICLSDSGKPVQCLHTSHAWMIIHYAAL